MTALPIPEFIPTDVMARLSAAILRFEQATGQTLYPAQPERLTLNSLVYENDLLATQLDLAMRRQLVEFADYPVFDRLARFYGLARLPPAPARTTVKITRAAADSLLILPAKTKLGGVASFTTNEELVFPIGVFEANCLATCTTPGKAYNGLAPGKINVFQDVLPGLCIENVTETRDGADLESDEALRKRVFPAPEAFTVAGSREAYEARAREVSPAIAAPPSLSLSPGQAT